MRCTKLVHKVADLSAERRPGSVPLRGTFLAEKPNVATYRDILDQLTTAVVVVDAASDRSFRISYLTQSAQSLFGRSDARTLGIPFAKLMRDDHATPAVLQGVLDTGQPFTKREVPLYVVDGLIRVNYSISPLSDTELLVEFDRLDRFIRIDRDERHVTLQETVRKLARGLAHEIKNPLGGLRGAAQLLDRQLANDGQREYTSVIISEADRLRNLVDRIMGPNGEVTFEPVNVHHVIERVVKLLEAESPAQVRFERSYDVSLPHVEADFERLVQATLNVLGNATLALKDTPDPCIRLETRVVRQFTIGPNRHRLVANVDFIDNGPGVPADIADRIFYPMISGRPEGSGLGLAITQTIIAQHNGLIECESEPGRTVFSVYLPISQPQLSATANGIREREGLPRRKREPSAGEREGLAPRKREPSAGEREGLAPRKRESSHGQ